MQFNRGLSVINPANLRESAPFRTRVPGARQLAQVLAIAALAGAALAATGCTNRSGALKTATSDLNKISAASSSNVITIKTIVKNASAPTSVFDILGDGSGAMAKYCTSTGGSAVDPTSGPSACVCNFSYANPKTGATESFETPTLYHEADLIRCSYANTPAEVTTVDVKVRLPSSNQASNVFSFKFAGTASPVDSASILNFAQVQRYMCRRLVKVPYIFNPDKLNDPLQIEDRHLADTLNFYTTNMGATFSYYAGGVNGNSPPYGWYCPSIPNDPNAKFDLNLYSVAADDPATTNSKKIYPATGSKFDRSNFYLAKVPTGVFTQPVNSYIAPFTVTSTAAGAAPPIGYAAAPIPDTAVAGKESCPGTSVPIPSGYHWAKLWLFRMSMPIKKYAVSQSLINMNEIACTPGPFSDGKMVFSDCNKLGGAKPSLYISDAAADPTRLASRAITGTGMCVNIDPLKVLGGPGYSGNIAGVTALGLASGSDVWVPNSANSSYACGSASDPAHICAKNAPYGVDVQTYDITPTNAGGIADANTSYNDFLFVVSPTDVNSGDMSNVNSATRAKYTPYRFVTDGDCTLADPDTCNATNALRNYGLKLHDVSTAGDPPPDDPGRPGSFPLCVLQPDGTP